MQTNETVYFSSVEAFQVLGFFFVCVFNFRMPCEVFSWSFNGTRGSLTNGVLRKF